MSRLDDFLRYLERDDVSELVLQTGSPVAVRTGDQLRALTRQKVSLAHITALVEGSPLEGLVPGHDVDRETKTFAQDGHNFSATFARYGEKLRVRIVKSDATRGGAAESHAGSGLELAEPPGPARAEHPAPQAAAAPPAGSMSSAGRKRDPATPGAAAPRAPGVEQATTGPERHLAGLLARARQANGSDVHLASGRQAAIRRAGQLLPLGQVVPDEMVRSMLLPLLSEQHRAKLDERGYTDLAVEIPGAGRLRANISRHRTGLKGCFRLVAPEPPTLEALGLPPELGRVTQHHQGLVVISGPNGQGKTTTMAALVDAFNAEKPIHILTVEDPIEVIHPVKRAVISQREVGTHTASFGRALKAALREDPDVIAIGELRDRETVEMAMGAAETGHLVLATMSTPSGARTIDRMIDMFPPNDQPQVRATLAGALKLVVSQRLLPTTDGSRLVAAAELITGSVPLWTLIRDNKLYQLPSLLQRGRPLGMIRIEDSLKTLLEQGLITRDAAQLYADDPKALGLAPTEPEAPPAVAASGTERKGLDRFFRRKGD